jgi:membrane associated rhomboid family serine protease
METAIRATRRAVQADEWVLVLEAAGVPHRLARDDGGWILLVPSDESPRAVAALEAYDAEARRGPRVGIPERAAPGVPWAVGLAAAAFLLVCFAVTGPPAAGSPWFERGAASASRIAGGEPWRAVTAMTLHVDAVHVAGNAVAASVLLPAVAQRLGPGLGLCLVLLAGAGGSLLGAQVHDSRLVAVGASTATFGAIGILAALQLFPVPGGAPLPRKRWVVVVAAVVLLAMLGTGREADVLGHALGLASGGALGLGAGAVLRRPPAASVQRGLLVLAALAVAGSWALALGSEL